MGVIGGGRSGGILGGGRIGGGRAGSGRSAVYIKHKTIIKTEKGR